MCTRTSTLGPFQISKEPNWIYGLHSSAFQFNIRVFIYATLLHFNVIMFLVSFVCRRLIFTQSMQLQFSVGTEMIENCKRKAWVNLQMAIIVYGKDIENTEYRCVFQNGFHAQPLTRKVRYRSLRPRQATEFPAFPIFSSVQATINFNLTHFLFSVSNLIF